MTWIWSHPVGDLVAAVRDVEDDVGRHVGPCGPERIVQLVEGGSGGPQVLPPSREQRAERHRRPHGRAPVPGTAYDEQPPGELLDHVGGLEVVHAERQRQLLDGRGRDPGQRRVGAGLRV